MIYKLFVLLPHGGATLAGERHYGAFFPKPPVRNPRNKIQQFSISGNDFQSVWQAGLPSGACYPKSTDRTLSQLFRRVAYVLEKVELGHYGPLFGSTELWYVLGILKRVD